MTYKYSPTYDWVNNANGNVWFYAAPSSWNTAEKIIFLGVMATAPTGAPANGCYIWYDGANLKARTTTGGEFIIC